MFSEQARQEIHIEMPDGSKRTGTSWETSPMDIAKEISKSLSERIVIAKVREMDIPYVPYNERSIRWMENSGTWNGLWRNPSNWNCSISITLKV